MRENRLTVCVGVVSILLSCLGRPAALPAGEKPEGLVLFDFEGGLDLGGVTENDGARAALVEGKTGRALRVRTGHARPWPGVTLPAPAGKWDLSRYEYLSLDVRNVGRSAVTVACRVDNPGADGRKNCITESTHLAAGAGGTLTVRLSPTSVRLSPPVKIIGMRAGPAVAGPLDPANVVQLIVFVPRPTEDHEFTVDGIRAGGRVTVRDAKDFFPFIDRFGQYIHKDWPGKTHSMKDLQARREQEAEELAARPGPKDWDAYGGWAAGPKLEATGFFRPQKHEGKWWLVDPQGRLFWSHGIDCVNEGSGTTPVTDRRSYFQDLPEADSPLAAFYGRASWAPHGYYQGKSYETYNFRGANLLRKYGADYGKTWAEVTHRRLRSWGLNTIGNWSSDAIYLRRRTPYVVAVHFSSRPIEGTEGYWGKFPDVFAEEFRGALRKRMARERGASAGDPWCIGYFVGNELSWGGETTLGAGALTSPPDQPAKRAFLDDLKAKYRTIEKLNAAWGTAHASWDALAEARAAPDAKKARADLLAFYTRAAETYFRICREEVKRAAPNNLYLGCRFAWRNDRAVRAAATSCDVVSFNLYSYGVADFRLPEGVDKPVIVGEFHFGALDRGMFHTGLRKTANQDERAKAYASYVRGALGNPVFVGTHWFQYGDQATTGRGDGENYQIGFVDICDTPYAETIAACREVGYGLYEYRMKAE